MNIVTLAHAHARTSLRGETGLSLVELMVAMAIGLLITAAVGSLYIGSKESARLQDGTSAARESAMATVEDITTELRKAGNYGCYVEPEIAGAAIIVTAKLPLAAGTRFPIPMDGTVPRVGPKYGMFGGVMTTAQMSNATGLTIVPGSDFLSFSYGDPATFLKDSMTAGTSDLVLGQSLFVSQGQPLLVSDCEQMTLLRADNGGLPGALTATISHNPSLNNNDLLANEILYKRYSAGALVMRLASATIFVATDTNGVTSLYRQDTVASNGGAPAPFALNVMNLRVRFGLEDGGVVTWMDGAAVSAAAKWDKIQAVRTHFVVASTEAVGNPYDMTWDNSKEAFVQASTFAADRKPRQAYSITTAIRGRVDLPSR